MFFRLGAFTPVTIEGNIVVDGILASCYAFTDHHAAHIGMTPIRFFPGTTDWILGGDNESSAYVNIVQNLGSWILPHELPF